MPTGFQTTVTLEVINTGTTQLLNLQPDMVSVTTPTCNACQTPVEVNSVSPTSFDSVSPGDIAVFEWVYSYNGENGDDVVFEAGILDDLRTDTATVTLQTVETSLNADIAIESGGLGDTEILGDHVLIFHMETTTGGKYQMYSGSAEGGNDGDSVAVDHDSSIPHFVTNNQTLTNDIPAGDWTLALMLKSAALNESINSGVDMIFHFEDGDDMNPDNSQGGSNRDLLGCGITYTTEYLGDDEDDAFEQSENGDVREDDHSLELALDAPWDDDDQRTVGLRFVSIHVPLDESDITSAYVEFTPRGNWENTDPGDFTNLRIYGEFDDTPVDFNGGSYNISTGRTLTTAYVDWMDIGDWSDNDISPNTTTPNLAPIIEEIVTDPGWSIDNDELVLIFYDHPDSPSTQSKVASSRDDSSSVAPVLRITYGVGNPPDWQEDSGPHGSGSYYFDGDSGSGGECFESAYTVSSNDDNDIRDSDATTSLWFKTNGQVPDMNTSPQEAYLVNWEDGPNEHYRIGLTTDGYVFFEVKSESNMNDLIRCEADDQRYDDNEWYNVVGLRNEGNGDDNCIIHIHGLDGTRIERFKYTDTGADDDVNISGVKWQVGANFDKDGNFFKGWIDDIMHWDDHDLTEDNSDRLGRTNYGDGAHRFIVNVDGLDYDGTYLRDIYDSVTYLEAGFADPKGAGIDDDFGYTQINMTIPMPSGLTVASDERLDLYFDAQGDEAGVWEALDGDIKIDDTSVGNPYPSLLEIQPPEHAFPTYFEHSPLDEFELYVTNTGSDGIFLTYQGTRISFNGTNGSYAGMIHSVGNTGGDQNDDWNMNADRDSLHIPPGDREKLYFYQATNVPSTNPTDGDLMVGGTYDVTVWLNGYSDQGESFLRSIIVGSVIVDTP